MNFRISENLKMIAETARDFAEKNIRPHIMDWDESQHFPKIYFTSLVKWALWELLSRKNTEAQGFLTMNM